MRCTPRRSLGLLAALALIATPLLAHAPATGEDDGHVAMRYSGTGGSRSWSLRTLEDRSSVRLRVVAHTGETQIHVRIADPDGREVADMQGRGELDIDSGTIRLVEHPAAKGEGRRGIWKIEVTTTHGDGSYELRWWGLAPAAHAGGEGG